MPRVLACQGFPMMEWGMVVEIRPLHLVTFSVNIIEATSIHAYIRELGD